MSRVKEVASQSSSSKRTIPSCTIITACIYVFYALAAIRLARAFLSSRLRTRVCARV
jgi:hypothetical protein